MCISIQTRSSPPASGAGHPDQVLATWIRCWPPRSGAGHLRQVLATPGQVLATCVRCWPPRARCWPVTFYMRGRSWHLDPHGTFGLQLSVLITQPHQSPQLHTQCVFPTLSYGVCMKLLNKWQTHTLWWQIMWYVGFLSAQGLFLMDHNYP